MIKIFHTGDLHLDSAFGSLPRERRISRRRRARELFAKMMKYAADEKFDMVLISGDLFDSSAVSPETEECVISAFSLLSCPIIIAAGNHDPYGNTPLYKRADLPENVYVFSSEELQIFSFEELGLRVCGYSFVKDTYYGNPLDIDSLPPFDGVSVLCAHTSLGAQNSQYAAFSKEDVSRLGFNYAALGHIHKQSEPIIHDGSVISYCGFAEGRAFDELGEGGALLVTVDGGAVSVEKIVFSEISYEIDTLDLGFIASNEEAEKKIEDFISGKNYTSNTALRLVLTGEAEMNFSLDVRFLLTVFSDRFMQLELIDDIRTKIDINSLKSDRTLRGEIYRTLEGELLSEDEETRRIASDALRAALLVIEGRELGGAL